MEHHKRRGTTVHAVLRRLQGSRHRFRPYRHCHRHQLVPAALCRHRHLMEQPHGHTPVFTTRLCRRDPHRQCPLALLPQLLYLQLLHGLLGLGTLAAGTRLDGAAWREHAVGRRRDGVCVERGAGEGLRLYARGRQHLRLGQCLLRLVLHEQPHRLGRTTTPELVHAAA